MRYGLVAFDVDGTLIELEKHKNIWELLNNFFKVDKRIVREMYEDFIAGRISYEEWASRAFEQYVRRGINKKKLYGAIENIKPMPGALNTLKELKRRNLKLAVISGSLDLLIKRFFPINLFSYLLINRVCFDKKGCHLGQRHTAMESIRLKD